MKNPVNVLHLSDLHFGIEPDEKHAPAAVAVRNNTLGELIETILALDPEWKPDIIAVTGDIGWKAKESDYAGAQTWIGSLLGALSLTADRLIITPGNHDISRTATRRQGLPGGAKEADEWLDPGEGFETMTGPFTGYIEFCKAMKIPGLHLGATTSYLFGVRDILGLRFVVLNSAWFCRGDDDKNRLWAGLPHLQILASKNQILHPDRYDDDPVTVALFHHPPDWWHDCETHSYDGRVNTERFLSQRAHILLAGHVHGHVPEAPHRPYNQTFLFTGGATYQGNEYRNHCGILRIDVKSRVCQKLCLIYEPGSAEGWRCEKQDPVSLKKPVVDVETRAGLARIAERFKPYCQAAYTEHRYLPFSGYVTKTRASIEIEKIYVTMRAHISVASFDYTIDGMRKLREWEERERLSDLDLRAAVVAADKRDIRGMVILGQPGSGKTTLLNYILIMIAEGKAEETIRLDSSLVPFLAPLRELREPDSEDLVDFIMRQCKLPDYGIAADEVRALLETGRAIVLLDGLDEVADASSRIRVCRWIDAARLRFPKTRFIVTSRYAGYFGESRLEGNLIELRIQDFNIQEIEQFLNYWFETIELLLHLGEDEEYWRRQAAAESADLLANIKKNPHVEALAVNPLMLQIIACIRKDRGTVLPERRVELYQECVNVFLERWDLAKNMPVAFRAPEARAVLQPLALWLHEKEERRSAPLDEIVEIIRKPLAKMNKTGVDPVKLLLNIRDRSGIFMGYNETEYGFTHLSFQEYLAAEEVRNRVMQDPGAVDILVNNYGNRWWREVTLLCLALDNPSIIDKFIERVVYTPAFAVNPAIVSDAIKESVNKPFEALEKALKDKKLPEAAIWNIVRLLREQGKEASAGRVEIKRGEKAKPEKPATLINEKDGSEMVLVPEGIFLYGSREEDKEAETNEKPQQSLVVPDFYIGVYPVTNAQYKKFIAETGHRPPDMAEWGKPVWKGKDFSAVMANHPVVCVSWEDAQDYAKWAGFRLPAEVEWEKAARGTDGRKYPWGEEWDVAKCNSSEGKYKGTTEVDRFETGKSLFGCFDMAGNVWEWCADWYSEDNDKSKLKDMLKGPEKGEGRRVLRGGSWNCGRNFLRCACRYGDGLVDRLNFTGFRCAR